MKKKTNTVFTESALHDVFVYKAGAVTYYIANRNIYALYPCGTYCHKIGTRPPSVGTPRQPTIHSTNYHAWLSIIKKKSNGWT